MSGKATPEQLAELIAARIDYARLADEIAQRLERPATASDLVSAKEIAERIGRSPRWVREHKAELGGMLMSDGPRPRIGFDPAQVDRVMAARRL
jgi:hypothetical protein